MMYNNLQEITFQIIDEKSDPAFTSPLPSSEETEKYSSVIDSVQEIQAITILKHTPKGARSWAIMKIMKSFGTISATVF